MAMENKRIIQLNTERTTPAADDYVMVDSATSGTAKYLLPKITDAIDQEISDRTSADTTLQGNITAEATARAAADTTINSEITQLKEDLEAEETARENAISAEADAREAADNAINAELATKADTDGAIASAEQILSDKYTIDQVPYTFRASGSSGADREYDEIVGGSVVWNSLASFNQSQIPSASNGITYTYTDGNSVLINGTATAAENRTGWFGLIETMGLDLARLNHKVLIYPKLISGTVEGSVSFTLPSNILATLGTVKIGVLAYSNTNQIRCVHFIANGTVCTNAKITIICVDLTAMFGSAVADYLYTLESATAGAGVAKLKSWGYPIDEYHEYNTGEMMHVSGISAHEMVGFNQWDEEWEVGKYNVSTGEKSNATDQIRSKNKIRILPNTQYYFQFSSGTMNAVLFYDVNEVYLGSDLAIGVGAPSVRTTPNNAHYMAFQMSPSYGTTYKNDICINLSGERDGEYEPYVKHSYPLDDSLTLRGIPKLDSNNQLYYDGDIYSADGTVTRKYGIVDLGTLTWYYDSSNQRWSASAPNGLNTNYRYGGLLSEKYLADTTAQSGDSGKIFMTFGAFYIYSTDSTINPSGMCVYPLATPTTETATPYNEVQIVDDFGTEEYVTTSLVPVGHYTKYPANLRSAIERVMEQIPEAPSANGTYVLKATKTSSGVTYAWVAE